MVCVLILNQYLCLCGLLYQPNDGCLGTDKGHYILINIYGSHMVDLHCQLIVHIASNIIELCIILH